MQTHKLKINNTMTITQYGLLMKRDLSVREACYCLRNLMGFDINSSIEEFEDEFDRKDYRNNITQALNRYIKGDADWNHLCEETYCYDYDNIGPDLVSHLRLVEYLSRKNII